MATKKTALKKTALKKSATKSKATKTEKPAVEVSEAPAPGDEAPPFALTADDGSMVDLASLKGKNVVLYFYPKDDTPGCTVEACGFRDHAGAFAGKNAVVLGVSKDSVASHARFRDKYNLSFRLLSDPEAKVIGAYGSWGEKKFMGRTFDGIKRTTVLIGKDGKVKKVYEKVSPKKHAEEVLADLEALG